MKKIFVLSCGALALAGCETAQRTPYLGGVGEYGYTYDLNAVASPFRDTSYRPLTAKDVMGPLTVVATNQVAITLINEELKERATAPDLSTVVQEVENPSTNTNAFPRPPAGTNTPERVVPLPNPPEIPGSTNIPPVTPSTPPDKNPSEEKPTTPP